MVVLVEDDEILSFVVPPEGISTRLDKWLVTLCDGFSRSRIQGLILAGRMQVNGETLSRTAVKVDPGDIVTLAIPPPVPAEPQPEDIPLSVVFEDEHVIVIDKLDCAEIKTKTFAKFLADIGADKKAYVLTPETRRNVVLSARNIPGVRTALANLVNTYDVLDSGKLVIDRDAVSKLEEVFGK